MKLTERQVNDMRQKIKNEIIKEEFGTENWTLTDEELESIIALRIQANQIKFVKDLEYIKKRVEFWHGFGLVMIVLSMFLTVIQLIL